MKICITLTFVAMLSAGCTAFSWGRRIFRDSPDLAEATAHAMEVGDASSHLYKADRTDTDNKVSSNQLPPSSAERPLPDENAIEPGLRNAENSMSSHASKQVIEPALAVAGEKSGGSDPRRHPEVGLVPTPEVERKEEQRLKEDSYSTIRKEIEDMSKQIGPMKPDGDLESSRRSVEDQRKTQPPSSAENHSTLTKGIEQAIAGLTSVYNTLRASNETDGSIRGVQVGERPDLGKKAKPESETSQSRPLSPTDREAQQEGNSTTSEATPASVLGESFNSSLATNGTEVDHASIVVSSADKDDEAMRKTHSGFSSLALLGGAAVIAAVGVFVVSHSQNEDTATTPTPLYPPRGLSYV